MKLTREEVHLLANLYRDTIEAASRWQDKYPDSVTRARLLHIAHALFTVLDNHGIPVKPNGLGAAPPATGAW